MKSRSFTRVMCQGGMSEGPRCHAKDPKWSGNVRQIQHLCDGLTVAQIQPRCCWLQTEEGGYVKNLLQKVHGIDSSGSNNVKLVQHLYKGPAGNMSNCPRCHCSQHCQTPTTTRSLWRIQDVVGSNQPGPTIPKKPSTCLKLQLDAWGRVTIAGSYFKKVSFFKLDCNRTSLVGSYTTIASYKPPFSQNV
jgi:hypothetical protein